MYIHTLSLSYIMMKCWKGFGPHPSLHILRSVLRQKPESSTSRAFSLSLLLFMAFKLLVECYLQCPFYIFITYVPLHIFGSSLCCKGDICTSTSKFYSLKKPTKLLAVRSDYQLRRQIAQTWKPCSFVLTNPWLPIYKEDLVQLRKCAETIRLLSSDIWRWHAELCILCPALLQGPRVIYNLQCMCVI